jgi:hypothetical protein
VKQWVVKGQPSLLQILHIFPVSNKITQPFYKIQCWEDYLRRIARYSGYQKFGIWGFSSFSYLFLPVLIIAFMSQITIFKNFGIKSMTFGKIIADHQDLCGISESGNNYFGLFATHFFTNSSLYSICCMYLCTANLDVVFSH